MPLQTTELLQPISGDKPGGEDIRYEPIFDRIKQARIEEDDIPAGDWSRERRTADWALVVKLSTEVIAKQSKDLQVAAWLTEGLLKREGFAGLRSGLELLRAMVVELWEHLYPEIEDDDLEFRAAPLEWLAHEKFVRSIRQMPVTSGGMTVADHRDSRAVGYEKDASGDYAKRDARKEAIEAGRPTAEDFDESFAATPKAWYKQLVSDIDGALAAVDALEAASQEKFGVDAPRYAPLRDAIQEIRQLAAEFLAAKLALDPDPIEPDAPQEIVMGDAGGAAAGGTTTVSAAIQSRADADNRIAAAARYIRSITPTDPAPYLMLRGLRWGELRVAGGEIDPKLLMAPPTDVRTRLKGLMLDGKHQQLLEAAEDVMATPFGRGWLDLQRYVFFACDGLGAGYDYVAGAIRGALRSLLRDVPQLPDLTLMDDSPTANVETRRWLQSQQLWGADVADDEPAPVRAATTHTATSTGDRLLERIRNEPPQRAVEILLRDAAQQKSARAKFLRRSQASRIMVDAGLDSVAQPILEEMVALIEKHGLEEWEDGETVAQPIGLLYRALGRLDGDSGTRQELYLRVCRLDPIQAMQFTNPAAPDDQGD